MRRQKIIHTYGDDTAIDEQEVLAEVQRKKGKSSSRLEGDEEIPAPPPPPPGARVNIGGGWRYRPENMPLWEFSPSEDIP